MMPIRWLSVLMLLAIFCIGYVLLDSMCAALNDEIRKLETDQEEIGFNRLREENLWASMTTSDKIDEALNSHGLNMALPRGDQVVRLRVTPAAGIYRTRDQYVTRR